VRVASVLALLGACGRDQRPDVVLIVLDTVRADHLSVYGYHRPTTPALEAFAAEATLYRRAISPGTWTPPSHASLFTGLMPSEHGIRYVDGRPGNGILTLNPAVETVAERLQRQGWKTAAFIGNTGYLDPVFGLSRGFERYERRGTYPAEPLLRKVGSWFTHRRGRSVFLFVNVMDPHEPYKALPPWNTLFAPEPPDYPCGDPAEAGRRIAQYDGELRYVDDQLGALFEVLRSTGRWDNALVIVTSDHGERLGEYGGWGHTGDPRHRLVHVPLIVKYPHGARRGVEERPVSLAALPDTILTVLGLPTLRGRPTLWEPPPIAVAEDVRRDVVVRSAYDAADRVLVALETATERRLELFDLRADPLEEHPQTVESGGGGVGAALAARLAETKATHVPCAPGPVVFPTADAELVERLRALGYLTE
jgi:arylsulfatase